MERLTDNTEYCTSWSDCEMPEGKCVFFENCYDRKIYNKLRKYEALEEQGILLRLPCKVGQEIYCIEEYEDGCDYSIYLYMATCNDFVLVAPKYTHSDTFDEQLEEMCEESQEYQNVSICIFPRKNVFLTKEEAEKALERMG